MNASDDDEEDFLYLLFFFFSSRATSARGPRDEKRERETEKLLPKDVFLV